MADGQAVEGLLVGAPFGVVLVHEGLEAGVVGGFEQVDQFVDDDVFEALGGLFGEVGVETDVVVVNKGKKPFISGLHTIVAKSKTDELAHEYRHYCFQTPAIRQQFLFYAVGTKVSGISKSNIPKLSLTFPPLPEQTAIATVLSDMDLELAALEQRRDKTRALKQGMMQELLTGRTRLL